MADSENVIPPSKKRAAGREISKDNPGLDDDHDETTPEQELGTFKKASDEVLATRRIVKVRRQTPSSAPSSNPFAGIRLVPPKTASGTPTVTASASVTEIVKEAQVDGDKGQDVAVGKVEKEVGDGIQNIDTKDGNGLEEKHLEDSSENKTIDVASEKETSEVKASGTTLEDNKSEVVVTKLEGSGDANKVAEGGAACNAEAGDDADKAKESDVQGLTQDARDENKVNENSAGGASNLNPFQQLSGSKNAFTGFTGTGFSGSTFSFNPIGNTASPVSVPSTGQKIGQPLFGFGLSSKNGNGSLFGTKDSSISKSEASSGPSLQEVPTETGEENETSVFSANSALFEYHDGGWKERGRGEIKVNVSSLEGSKARLVMRTKGNYRLIMNASLYPEMKLTYMDKKGITFACINSNGEEKGSLSTYALKFKDGFVADEFHAVVTAHKGTPAAVLKTPENSPQ